MKRLSPDNFKTAIVAVALLAALLLPVTGSAGSINKNAGTTGFSFLKLGVGAKAVAMGGAYTAVADDPSTLYYNPAGTVNLNGRQMMAGYHNYVLDMQSGFVSVTMPLMNKHGLGFFIDYLNFGDFSETNDFGEVIGDFSGGDFLVGANFSTTVYRTLAAGINVKFMTERADNYSSEAVSIDLGLLYRFQDERTQVGLAVTNLRIVQQGFSSDGASIGDFPVALFSFVTASYSPDAANENIDDLPISIRAGVAHSLRELPLLASLDAVIPNDNDPYVNVGLELYKLQPLYLRLGYSTFGENYKTESNSSGLGGFSFGFGVDVEEFHIGYAFMPYLDLGSSHRVTVIRGF